MHKCLKMESPSYLSSKLSTVFSLPERKRLRSSNTMDIARVRANAILGNKRFEVVASILWIHTLAYMDEQSSRNADCNAYSVTVINPFSSKVFIYKNKTFS